MCYSLRMFEDILGHGCDIEITKKNERTEAFCPIFPDCFGVGDTEDEAIEDLADSVALYIGDVVKSTVSDIAKNGRVRHISEKGLKADGLEDKADILKEKIKRIQDDGKGRFMFSPQFREDTAKIDLLFKNNARPAINRGLLSVIGLRPLANLASSSAANSNSNLNNLFNNSLFSSDLEGFVNDFFEERTERNGSHSFSYDVSAADAADSMMLGIPLSFN